MNHVAKEQLARKRTPFELNWFLVLVFFFPSFFSSSTYYWSVCEESEPSKSIAKNRGQNQTMRFVLKFTFLRLTHSVRYVPLGVVKTTASAHFRSIDSAHTHPHSDSGHTKSRIHSEIWNRLETVIARMIRFKRISLGSLLQTEQRQPNRLFQIRIGIRVGIKLCLCDSDCLRAVFRTDCVPHLPGEKARGQKRRKWNETTK